MKVILYLTKKLTSKKEAELMDALTDLAEDFPYLDEIEFDYEREKHETKR